MIKTSPLHPDTKCDRSKPGQKDRHIQSLRGGGGATGSYKIASVALEKASLGVGGFVRISPGCYSSAS